MIFKSDLEVGDKKMKIINLDLPYRKKPDEQKAFPRNSLITEMIVRALVTIRYAQGMNETDTRIWGRLLDLMDEATAEECNGIIEVEKSDILWLLGAIKWCMENSKVPAPIAHWVSKLLNHLEEIKLKSETKLDVIK